ncbi:MAG: hypothetical protein ACHQ2Y_01525 [Candidatus Lutacidiplasmatales archaeon]
MKAKGWRYLLWALGPLGVAYFILVPLYVIQSPYSFPPSLQSYVPYFAAYAVYSVAVTTFLGVRYGFRTKVEDIADELAEADYEKTFPKRSPEAVTREFL